MRRIVFSFSLFVLTVATANAQDFRLGVSGGVDASRMAISGASGGPLVYKTEVAGGIVGELGISPTFGVQIEGNYSSQGAGVINQDGSTAGSYNFTYITVPVLARLNAHKGLSFLAGPQVGFLMEAETKTSGDPDTDVKEQIEKMDFYAVFGAEYRFENGVFIGTRFNAGLKNAIKDDASNTEIKNRYFSFRVGYSFSFNKKK